MEAVFVRSPYNYDVKVASDEAGVDLSGHPSLTVQSMAEDADINVLMRRYGITGVMPENPRLPSYGDFTGIGDYRTALEAVRGAEDAFMELTADVRAFFRNDPQLLLDFVENHANADKARELGLLKPVDVLAQPPLASAPAIVQVANVPPVAAPVSPAPVAPAK